MILRLAVALALLGLFAPPAFSQGMDYATTVQLPTFHSFSVLTTVSVPDRGGAYLGGIGRVREGRNEFGVPMLGKLPGVGPLFGSRSIGREVSHAGASVHATIIDHEELDKAVLAEARARRSIPAGVLADEGLGASGGFASGRRAPSNSPAREGAFDSLAAIRAKNAAEDELANREALDLIASGEAAEQAGKWQSARSKYLTAANRATGEVKSLAARKAQEMSGKLKANR